MANLIEDEIILKMTHWTYEKLLVRLKLPKTTDFSEASKVSHSSVNHTIIKGAKDDKEATSVKTLF